MITAAILTTIILTGLTLFQIALITGAPIGRFAWGGQHNVLPKNLRIGSATSVLLYLIFALIILNRSGIINLFTNDPFGYVATWVLFAYFALGIGMNAISRSKPERLLMTPIAASLAILVLVVALGQ